jgi:hypothetical protein
LFVVAKRFDPVPVAAAGFTWKVPPPIVSAPVNEEFAPNVNAVDAAMAVPMLLLIVTE